MLRILCVSCPNVLGFLGGLDEPTPVPQSRYQSYVGTAVEETEFEENLDCPYAVNDTVKVMDGPFSGFSGVIEEVNLEKRKLKVTVKIFGRKDSIRIWFYASRKGIRLLLRVHVSFYKVSILNINKKWLKKLLD